MRHRTPRQLVPIVAINVLRAPCSTHLAPSMAGVQTVSRRLPGSVGGRRVAWHRRHGPKRAVITAAAEERLERQDRYNHESRQRQAGVCVDSDRAGQRGRKSWAAVLDAVPPCARRVALEQLLRIDDDGAYAGLVFGSPDSSSAEPDASDQQVERRERHLCQARSSLDDRDARFVTELVSGVVRWRRRLDYVISVLTNRSSTDIEPMMLQVLRMGLYELVVLRSPPHVINEHVELVKAVVRPEAASFANGVLRTASRKIASGTLPEVQVGQLTTAVKTSKEIRKHARLLGIAHSHPTWMVARWLRQLGGPATQRLLEWNNRRPLYGLRLNTLRGVDQNTFKNLPVLQEQAEAAGVELKLLPSPFLPREFLRVERGLQKILRRGLVADGTCSVQDEAAGLVVAMLDPQPGEKLLDACAAPGGTPPVCARCTGKCLFAGMRMGGEGSLTAVDISARRLDAVLAAAEVQGLRHMVRAVPGDLREMPRERLLPAGSGGFDRVLLDAPCSGTGVLARRADLRWRRTKEQLADLEGLQDQLLDAAAALVRPGGLLVYSTCSIEPEENVLRIRSFLSRHSGFRLAAPPEGVPVAVLVEPGVLQTMPFAHGIDGAFAARLQRCEGGTV